MKATIDRKSLGVKAATALGTLAGGLTLFAPGHPFFGSLTGKAGDALTLAALLAVYYSNRTPSGLVHPVSPDTVSALQEVKASVLAIVNAPKAKRAAALRAQEAALAASLEPKIEAMLIAKLAAREKTGQFSPGELAAPAEPPTS